jgi:hypothetical protein
MKKTTTAILVTALVLMISCKKSQPATLLDVISKGWVSTSVIDSTSGNIDSSNYLSYSMSISLNHHYYGVFSLNKKRLGQLVYAKTGSVLLSPTNDSLLLINTNGLIKDTSYFIVRKYASSSLYGVLKSNTNTSIITFK